MDKMLTYQVSVRGMIGLHGCLMMYEEWVGDEGEKVPRR